MDGLGELTAQVALDIGVHLELDVPKGTGWHEGERWNAEIAWEILRAHSSWDERQLRSELRRCLGLPGQAPSYKLGEQIWLQAREDAMARAGAGFSLKDFTPDTLLPGVKINTSATDFAPIEQLQMQRFKGEKWDLFGDIINGDLSN